MVAIFGMFFGINGAVFADEDAPEEDADPAMSVSISPVSKILNLEPNSTYDDSFKVTNNSKQPMKFEVHASPYSYTFSEENNAYMLGFSSENNYTQIVRWITFADKDGKYVKNTEFVAEPEVLARIEAENLVALRYCSPDGSAPAGFPENPNGSLNDIAGICDSTGRIFGLMPHPEAFLSPYNAPDWQNQKLAGKLPQWGEGKIIFDNAVKFAAENLI